MDPDKFFIGIEGGATHSHLVVLDTTGKHYGEWENEGLNYYLHGVPQITTKIAEWIRKVKKELEIVGPIAAVGMGLSGAEDEKINKQVINILRVEHGDVAKVFVITTDSLITIATAFDKGGVVLIAGTGSSCRLLKSDSSVKRVGGWGHLIGDGGSAFWIANNALRTVCDDDDGLSPAPYPTKRLKMLILKHFKVPDMVGMLDLLYTNFVKSNIASLTKSLAVDGIGDPMVREIFRQAGEALGRHIRAISRYLDESMLSDIPVVTVGSVWKSWPLLKQGFIEGVRDPERKIKAVTLHRLEETPAVGAALMAAKNNGVEIPLKQRTKVLDVIDCRRIDKVQESGPGSRTNAVTHPSAEINEVAIDHQTKLDDGRYSQTMNPYRSTC